MVATLEVKQEDGSDKSRSPGKPSSQTSGIPRSSHMHGIFPCGKCGRTYIRKDSLQRHLQWECGKEPTFQCPFCPQRSKRKAHQIRHMRRQHKNLISVD